MNRASESVQASLSEAAWPTVVLDGLDIAPLRLIRVAEVSVRPALPYPVAHLLCNRQALRVVLDGLAEVPLRLIRVAEVPVRRALPRPPPL